MSIFFCFDGKASCNRLLGEKPFSMDVIRRSYSLDVLPCYDKIKFSVAVYLLCIKLLDLFIRRGWVAEWGLTGHICEIRSVKYIAAVWWLLHFLGAAPPSWPMGSPGLFAYFGPGSCPLLRSCFIFFKEVSKHVRGNVVGIFLQFSAFLHTFPNFPHFRIFTALVSWKTELLQNWCHLGILEVHSVLFLTFE